MNDPCLKERGNNEEKYKRLIITVVLTVLLSLLNWYIVSDHGNVKIQRVHMTGDDGFDYSGLVYTPKQARTDNKAPGILMVHGAAGNARNHESWAVEFARRGFVVVSIDWNGAGESDSYGGSVVPGQAPPIPEYWEREITIPEYWLKYLLNMTNVDTDNVIISGHSMGCPSSALLSEKYQLKGAILAGGSRAGTQRWTGAYTGAVLLTTGTSDSNSYETNLQNCSIDAQINGFIKEGELIEWNKVYGSFESGKVFQSVLVPKQNHEFAFANKMTIGSFLDFSQKLIEVPNYIDDSDQVWFNKDIVGQLGIYSFAAMLVFLYLFILDQVPAFAEIRQSMPRNIGLRKVGLAIAIVLPMLVMVLYMKTGTLGLLSFMQSHGFDMGHPTRALSLVVGSALFGLVMLYVFWVTDAKKVNADLYDLGLADEKTRKIEPKKVFKSLVVAIIIVTIGWTYLDMQTKLLGTDFYCLFWGFKPIAWNKFKFLFPYIIVWVLCFILSNLSMNVERRLPSTGDEKKDAIRQYVMNIVLSILPISVIIIVQFYLQLNVAYRDYTVMQAWSSELTRLWGMPVGMSIGAFGNTYLYRKTGSIWPGVFLMGILCCLGAVMYGQYGCYTG